MNRWNNTSAENKRIAYNQLSEQINLPAFAVEKDWWVVQTLSVLFQTDIGKHLVFKGGTSLSKAWNIIKRFSEDIDLAVDRSFFGFEGNLGKNQRDKLRKKSKKYITEVVFPELITKFEANSINGVKIKLGAIHSSDHDPVIINVYYPNVIETPGYIQPRVQIEIGSRSLREPYEKRAILSFVDERYSFADFAQDPVHIPTVLAERTFLEKMFLLHEEYQRPKEKSRINRLSRHLYDVYKISQTPFAQKSLENRYLYEKVVIHRNNFTRLGGVDYNLHNPQTLCFIPPDKTLKYWENDYHTMQEEMIYGESPSFKDLLKALKALNKTINEFSWKMEMKF